MRIVKLSIVTAGAVLVAFGTVNKAEAITFSENFDGAATGLGLTDAGQFNANANPNIDVIGQGSDFNPFQGNGRYVDLDGTPSASASSGATDGTLVSNTAFALSSNEQFTLSFALAGNPFTNTPDSVTVTLGSFTTGPITAPNNTGFSPFSFTFVGDNSTAPLSFISASGSDGGGLYLDNVSLTSTSAAVPFELSPALGSLVLVAWGVGVGVQRKLKTKPELLSRLMVK